MKSSQNLETDLIFDHLGELARPADSSPWLTSESLAVKALDKFLAAKGIPADVHFDEGSGLSRNNLTSANATAALLAFMSAIQLAGGFTYTNTITLTSAGNGGNMDGGINSNGSLENVSGTNTLTAAMTTAQDTSIGADSGIPIARLVGAEGIVAGG